jgi:PAS domain S-box-containing protein
MFSGQRTQRARPASEWLAHLRVQAELLDGIEVGLCAFDLEDRAILWNRTFLQFFPEHAGHITEGEHYADNLRRFYRARLDPSELPDLERHVQAGIARHQAQLRPFEFEHAGRRIQVSSLPVADLGRIRVWRSLQPLPPVIDVGVGRAYAAERGTELLECVPEALLVCGRDGRILWANASFCSLLGVGDGSAVLGSTLEALYRAAWDRLPQDADAHQGADRFATLRENLRYSGRPFELPLPDGGCCRVIGRPAPDGAVFYALIDISQLKLYESGLQLTLDNAGRGILRYDAYGRVLLFNQQARDLLDLPDTLLNASMRMEEVIRFQQERGDFAPADGLLDGATALPGHALDLYTRNRYLRRTRSGRVLEIGTQPLADGGAVRTFSDVTAYVEAQEALSEKTRALQITLDSMSQGISAIDASGRLVFWNRRYQEMLRLPDALLQNKPTMDDLVHFQTARGDFGPDFALVEGNARSYVAKADRIGALLGPETYIRRTTEGRIYDVTTRPLPDGGAVRTFTDITAHMASEHALAEKQAQLGALVNNLPDRVWLKDNEGRFMLSNPAHQRYHQRAEADILGRTAGELFGPQVGALQAESDRRAMESDTPVAFEEAHVDPSGTLRHAEVIKVALRGEDGTCLGLLGIARDISARKRQEATLIQAKEEALSASGAKSRFLSSMSHEIRTPMNAVLGMLSLLRATPMSPRQDDYAGKAEGAAKALLSLLNDILDFSKIEAGKMSLDPRPFSLANLIADLSVVLSSGAGKRPIDLHYELDPQVPDALVGDDMRLRQILINLGGNAVKFTERGDVTVRTRLVERDEGHALIEFAVQDTGIGITEEQQKRLFTDYAQAGDEIARRFGGTGLGLGISRRLTELMGASLQLESSPGLGSRFWFTVRLPVCELPLWAEPPSPESATDQQPLAGIRLLLAEDNLVNQQIAVELLARRGAEVDVVVNGREAVDHLFAGRHYDAILMDVHMPVLDGLAATRLLRSGFDARSLPIIAMTANAMETDRQACLAAGMNDHVAKPFVIDELVDTILHHVARQGPASRPPVFAATAGAAQVWNKDAALQRLGGDEALLQSVLAAFRRNLDQSQRQLSAFGQVPPQVLADALHGVKGMAANVGAQPLAALASQAEAQLRQDPAADAAPLVRQVLAAIEAVRMELG